MRGQGKRGEKIKVYELMSLCLTLMLSIKPKWCELIASGRKTIEVRKTRPKLETPFKCYIYCTKDKGISCRKIWDKAMLYINQVKDGALSIGEILEMLEDEYKIKINF